MRSQNMKQVTALVEIGFNGKGLKSCLSSYEANITLSYTIIAYCSSFGVVVNAAMWERLIKGGSTILKKQKLANILAKD